MKRTLHLLRHPPVIADYHKRCYGQTDVGLAEGWTLPEMAKPDLIVHSGFTRTRVVAEAMAAKFGMACQADARLAERHFGEWEGLTWAEIYEASGDAMMNMIHQPDTWRTPGGETTFEVRDRLLAWYAELPDVPTILAVTHGGAIASLLGALRERPVSEWVAMIPKWGELTTWEEER
jgi:broad specificity phosphatase PhoE